MMYRMILRYLLQTWVFNQVIANVSVFVSFFFVRFVFDNVFAACVVSAVVAVLLLLSLWEDHDAAALLFAAKIFSIMSSLWAVAAYHLFWHWPTPVPSMTFFPFLLSIPSLASGTLAVLFAHDYLETCMDNSDHAYRKTLLSITRQWAFTAMLAFFV